MYRFLIIGLVIIAAYAPHIYFDILFLRNTIYRLRSRRSWRYLTKNERLLSTKLNHSK
jgi:hypothetical protein